MEFYYYSIIAGAIAIIVAAICAMMVLKRDEGSEKMKGIAEAIREGAYAYLRRQAMTIAVFTVILSVLFAFSLSSGVRIVLAFLVGAIASYLTAYLGMSVAVRSNVRTARAAEKGLNPAFRTAILGGAVTGFAAVGFSLIGLGALLAYFTTVQIPLLIGFGFGASLISLFARVGGGIYTKAADVGADLVGKTELNLPEDDVRNPATIADNVGDNVGDCAGMAADVFESYSVTLVAALLIANSIPGAAAGHLFSYPIYVAILGVFASVAGIYIAKVGRRSNIIGALYKSILVTVVIAAVLDYALTYALRLPQGYFISVLSGLVLAFLLFWVADYYTGSESRSVKKIATASTGGAGTNVIMGLAVGLRTTWMPAIFVVAAILVSYIAAGNSVYGIAIAAAGMFSLTATVLTIDSFGPITDNAGGIAEMSQLPHSVRKITDALDGVGNTTKATTKGFAIGGAALSAVALFVAFANAVGITATGINVLNPLVTAGIFIGAMLPFIFSSFLMEAVGHAANKMVEEVRRQVRTIKGLMQGKAKPDYARAVDIATVNALRSLALPEMVAILTPIIVGLVFGVQALGGLLVGMIPTSFMLALFMANAGGAMDNAKKYIEGGKFGGKGSDAHKAAVVGDTLGDPLKDTAGPALNSMIKVVSTISILLAPLFLAFALVH